MGRKRLVSLVIATAVLGVTILPAVASSGGGHHGHPHKRYADTVFLNGKVLLYEKRDRWASARRGRRRRDHVRRQGPGGAEAHRRRDRRRSTCTGG